LGVSDAERLSVLLCDVHEGRESDFVAASRAFEALLHLKGYGRMDVVRDERVPRRYYAVRYWTDAAAAEWCHADPEARELASQVRQFARVTAVVDGTGTRDAPPAAAAGRDRAVDLVAAAREARLQAAATFSRFKVGAALETADGVVVTGCNVENASLGLTMCAERVAVFKAVSEGHRTFIRIAIVADTGSPTPPCGACRQILWEFGGDLEVTLANLTIETGTYRLAALLPLPFDSRLL
jgi:cytidine deaminase